MHDPRNDSEQLIEGVLEVFPAGDVEAIPGSMTGDAAGGSPVGHPEHPAG